MTFDLEIQAYRCFASKEVECDDLVEFFKELGYERIPSDDTEVYRTDWPDADKNQVIDAKFIVKKDDFKICCILTKSGKESDWKRIAKRIIQRENGDCLVLSRNPTYRKWIFSSLSQKYSDTFSETRNAPLEFPTGERTIHQGFLEFFKKITTKEDDVTTTIARKISDAFNNLAVQIHDELTINVFDALKILSDGIIADKGNNLTLNNETLEEIRAPIFTLLYRIIFILYAEDRGIFDIEDPTYHEKFSLKWIKEKWFSKSTKTFKAEFEVQKRLQDLFKLIELGSVELGYSKEEFFMRSYYGRLFDRQINNKLDKWKISNSHLIDVLKLLTRTTPDKKGNHFLLDYEALETRQLGAVYEKLLQYRLETIEVKDGNNKIRKVIKELPKPKERKDTGSVYTPQLIVDFMVKISLEPILKNISDKYPDKLEQEKKILELKILDPAIGSGHFLVGIINYLGKKLCDLKFGEDYGFEQLIEKKREVLRRCIYGVDINQLAVDLAMLTLWLETAYSEKPLSFLSNHLKCGNSLISSELNTIFSTQTTLSEHDGKIPLGTGKKKLRKMIEEYLEIEMLPDDTKEAVKFKMDKVSKMDTRNSDKTTLKNILNMTIAKKFGVDVPPLGDLTAKFGNQSIEYYSADWAVDFERLIDRIKPIHLELEFPEIFFEQTGEKKTDSGFDVIIGNPPYIKEYENKSVFVDVRKSKCNSSRYYQGKMDYWYLFATTTLDILKKYGTQCFVATQNWPTAAGATKLRDKILTECKIEKFLDFGDYKVFGQNAAQQVMIYLALNDPNDSEFNTDTVILSASVQEGVLTKFLVEGKPDDCIKQFTTQIKREKGKKIYFFEEKVLKLKNKIKQNKNVIYLKASEVAQGIVCPTEMVKKSHLERLDNKKIGDGIFVLSAKEKNNLKLNAEEKKRIKPFYTSEQLFRYYGNPKNSKWIIYNDSQTNRVISRLPNLKKHLEQFKDVIGLGGEGSPSHYGPFGLHRSRDEKFFKGEKILSLRKTRLPRFTFVNFDSYVTQSYVVIKSSRINLKYLTALLNSSLANFWFASEKKQGGNLQIDNQQLESFPIIIPDKEKQKIIVSEVEKLIKKPNSATSSDIQLKIDDIIYRLYGLNDTERIMIEDYSGDDLNS